MSRSVGLDVLRLRDRAPEMYSRAIRLHCSIAYKLSDAGDKRDELWFLVSERPSQARLIIKSFELADSDYYSCIISILHSMIARENGQRLLDEIERGA